MVRFIVTADDFGRADGINIGIIESFKQGIVTGASILLTGARADEAILFARENPALGVGLHLDLDRFCLIKRPEGFVEGFKQHPVPVKDILNEARRQIERFKDAGLNLYHLDSHHHSHLRPELFPMIVELLKEFRINTVRFSDDYYKENFKGQNIKDFRGILKESGIATTDYFISQWDKGSLDRFSSGSVELMTHPGYPGEGVTLAEWRINELKFCLDAQVKEEFKIRGVKLITFKEL